MPDGVQCATEKVWVPEVKISGPTRGGFTETYTGKKIEVSIQKCVSEEDKKYANLSVTQKAATWVTFFLGYGGTPPKVGRLAGGL